MLESPVVINSELMRNLKETISYFHSNITYDCDSTVISLI